MAIYIKNIPMPKDGEHPIWISLHSDGTVEYNANKGDGWQITTSFPVPPHGRVIDADKQDAQIEALIERHLHGYTKSTWDFVCELRGIISGAPTIIPAEEGET